MGLKAKPTKPVTEVLRPVVAKYGLHLGDLVAKIVSHPLWPLMCFGPVKCVTVLLGGVSWLGEGSNRILFHLHVVVKSSDSALWSTGAAIKNDDAPQTRQLFILLPPNPPTARWFILDLRVLKTSLSVPELKEAPHF